MLVVAGNGYVKRLDDRMTKQRQKFVAARQEAIAYSEATEVSALPAAMKSGPFGDGSLFAKAQNTILTTEQIKTYERRLQLVRRSTKKITIDNVRDLETIARFRKDVFRIEWRDDNEVGLLQFDEAVRVCSANEFQPLRTLGVRHKPVGFDFSRDCNLVAIAENSKKAFVINLSTNKETALETGNAQPSVTFSPDGKLLATGGYGTKVSLWSVESGKRIREFDCGTVAGGLTPVFSPDGKILAIGNRNFSTRLFDVATGRVLRVLIWQRSHELKFDPAGKRLAVAYVDGQLGLWSVESGELLARVTTRANELYSVDWSPDGQIIASSGLDASVALWSATNLRLLREIESPEWIICVRFNPQGTRLVFAGGTQAPGGERYVQIMGVP
jgi:hypothetical protein